MMINGISAYRLYLMLKHHFNGKHDVIKYCWSGIKVTDAAYIKNNQKLYFDRMCKKFTLGELSDIMIFNFIANPDSWGGNVADSDAVSHYVKTLGKIAQMEKTFASDVEMMLYFATKKQLTFKQLMFPDDGQPWIFKFVQQNVISYETLLLLDNLFDFVDTYDLNGDHVWANGYANRIKAYRKLVTINTMQAKTCLYNTIKLYKNLGK